MKKLTYFGQKCEEMRQRLNVSQDELAKKMGFTQAYLSKLENGKKPLSIPLLKKYLAAFVELGKIKSKRKGDTSGIFTLEDQLELTRELFERSEYIEIKLSDISIIHRNSITRLMAILSVNDYFPLENPDSDFSSWLRVNEAVRILEEDPKQYKPTPLDIKNRFDGYYKNMNK